MTKKYQTRAKWSTEKSGSGKAAGVIFGKWFVGTLWQTGDEKMRRPPTMTILVLKSTHQKVSGTEDQDKPKDKTPKNFKYYCRGGTHYHVEYSSTNVAIPTVQPRPFQSAIVNSIVQTYESKGTASVVISGPAGCGKSSICDQLIRYFSVEKKQKCCLTDEFRPSEASDFFHTLYSEVDPVEEDTVFIVLLDEVDGILRQLGGPGITPHPKFFIQVKNKTEWNSFFDKIDKGRWKNTIFILTSNLSLENIDQIDPSYTRPGRINHRFEVSSSGALITQTPGPDGLTWA